MRHRILVWVFVFIALNGGCMASSEQAYPLCALDGTCPAGMACNGSLCRPIDASETYMWNLGADATSDAPSMTDTSESTHQDSWRGGDNAPVQDTQTQAQSDGGAKAPWEAGDVAVTSLQKNSVCAQPTGSPVGTPLTLNNVIVSGAMIFVGSYPVFFVRDVKPALSAPQWSGLKVFVFGAKPKITPTDILQLKGELVEYYCETQLRVQSEDIKTIGSAEPVQAYEVKPSNIAYDEPSSEVFEGAWITIKDVEIVQSNMVGTDGKTHGDFAVRSVNSTGPIVAIGPTSGTSFSALDSMSGQVTSKWSEGTVFSSIRGHLHYSFGRYVLRPPTDQDLGAP